MIKKRKGNLYLILEDKCKRGLSSSYFASINKDFFIKLKAIQLWVQASFVQWKTRFQDKNKRSDMGSLDTEITRGSDLLVA